MLYLGRQTLGAQISSSSAAAPTPLYFFRWKIDQYHKSGGLKNSWNLGESDCPISEVKFELNLHGCGAGEITFAFLDFPIDSQDYFNISFNGVVKYQGIVEESPDLKGGPCALIPRWNYYKNRLQTHTYTAQTITQIMTDIVTTFQASTGILLNGALINPGSATTYSIAYDYQEVNQIMDDLVGKLNGGWWSVDQNGFFNCGVQETSTSTTLFQNDTPAFSDLQYAIDLRNIDATRYQVYRKTSGSSGTSRIGQVGYGAPYPVLPIENLITIKEGKITFPEAFAGGDTDALVAAYAILQSKQGSITITLNNMNLDVYFPVITKKLGVQDREANILQTIIECDTLTGWGANVSQNTTNYVSGIGSVQATLNNIGDAMVGSLAGQTIYNNPTEIGLMINSSQSGNFLQVNVIYGNLFNVNGYSSGSYGAGAYSAGDGTGTNSVQTTFTNTLSIPAASVWSYYSFPYPSAPISQISVSAYAAVPTGSAVILIDRIQVYETFRQYYEYNLVQANFDIKPDSEIVTGIMNQYEYLQNKELFDLVQLINNTQSTQSSN